MYTWRVLIGTAVVCGTVSCATVEDKQWYQQARTTSTKAIGIAADTTSKAFKRTQHYLEEKDVLKTFQDASNHSESAVLDVLHRSGVGHKAAPGTAVKAPGAAGKAAASPAVAGRPGSAVPAAGKSKNPDAALPARYAAGLRWPLDDGVGIVSSGYGPRWGKMHKGMDLAADAGEPVYAIGAGEVIYAGDGLRGYGNVVIVRHDSQMTSLYAHNSELKVHQGDHVTEGSLLALLGTTGHSTGPHVHFEIREGDAAVDPSSLLPKATFADNAAARHHQVAATTGR